VTRKKLAISGIEQQSPGRMRAQLETALETPAAFLATHTK
jgi:hypothetical protein